MADIRVKILVFQHDGTVVSQYLLGEGVHVIGRDPNSAIYAESEYISNEHAKLHLTDEGIFIEDLNSTAGTFLDDVTVRGKLRLNPGQRLQIGDLYIDLQMEAAGELTPGAKIGAGRYQLVKELGRGAMGQVWLGQDTQLDEHVAIKVLNSDVASDAVSLLDLKREVQKSRKLSHDNIIRIHDLVQLPGENPFITLEYVEGTDLHAIQLNQPDRIFQWAEVKPYVLQLCDALDYAHERKIVHRDLKAPNIMITQDGVLKLADFGIAASIADATGRSSMADIISGTPQFMSPQQMLGKSPKASDDIYALGATIYDLLTGRPPFHTGDIAQQVHHVTPAPLEQRLAEFGLQNSVPDYVNSVVMSCLAKDPEARPTSAGAIGEWIRTEGKSDSPAKRKKTKTGVEKITPEEPAQPEAAPVMAQPQPPKDKKTPVLAIAAVAAIAVILGVLFLGKSGGKDENQNQGGGSQAGGKGGTEGQPVITTQMQAKLKEGLIAYYPFNGNAKDESGNGHDGEVKGATLAADRNNVASKAYSFVKASGQHIAIPDTPDFHLQVNTISAWVRFNSTALPGHTIISKEGMGLSKVGGKSTPTGFTLGYGGAGMNYGLNGSGKYYPTLHEIIPEVGRWYLVTGTYDGSTRKLYTNGKLVKAVDQAFTLSHDATEVRIGDDPNPSTPRYFDGKIDDIRIYNRALSVGEITALYDLEKPSSETASGTKKPGTLLWQFETGRRVRSSPAIGSDGTVYVGSADNKLYAINPKSGAKLWEFETGGFVRSSPAIGSDGTVYVGSNYELYAINGKSGVKLWEFKTESFMSSSPAIGSDGTIYVGSYDKKLYAINGQSGVKLWEFETGGEVFSSPAIGSDGTVYVGSYDHKLYAINGKSGVKLWQFKTGDEVRSSPAIGSDGTVYVGSRDNKLYAINPKSGVKLWEFETGGGVESSPAIGPDGAVYVGSKDKKLYAINGKGGVKLWEFETGGNVDSPAIGSDGTVYVGSWDKKLYAINGKSGVKLWEYETGGDVDSCPAIGSDGTVYVGSRDGKVYALASSSKGPAKSPWPMFRQNAQRTGRAKR
jgi:outer membrane protein assembly factor BamB